MGRNYGGMGSEHFPSLRPHTILQDSFLAHCWKSHTRQEAGPSSKRAQVRTGHRLPRTKNGEGPAHPSGPGELWLLASTITQREGYKSHNLQCRIEENYWPVFFKRAPRLSPDNSVSIIIPISFPPLFMLLTVRASTSYCFVSK